MCGVRKLTATTNTAALFRQYLRAQQTDV